MTRLFRLTGGECVDAVKNWAVKNRVDENWAVQRRAGGHCAVEHRAVEHRAFEQ